MKVKVDDVKFIKELYPRVELDNYTVNQYRNSIDKLPPIIISRSYKLIDGYHRLIAHRLEELYEIEAEWFESEDDKEILIEAIRLNSRHGKQLTIEEKKHLAPKLYGMSLSLDEICDVLGVAIRTARAYTEKIRANEKEKRDSEILELYLQCLTQEQIAEKLEVSQDTVSRTLNENGKLAEIVTPSNIQYYNVWNIGKLTQNQLKYPGQTPLDIVENIIYYYTEPTQKNPLKISKVLDPMAGSGIVRQACLNLNRRYLLYDIKPIRQDIPITKHDILKPFPKEVKDVDLVYFDPPYYNIMSEYPDNSFTNGYDNFLNSMNTSFENFRPVLNDSGKVALILMPINETKFSEEWLDLTFESCHLAKELGYKIVKRISAPTSTQQHKAYDLTRAKESRTLLNVHRDIVIFEK